MPNKNSVVHINDINKIKLFIQSRSSDMYKYMEESSSEFSLWSKTLFHSDLTGRGKREGNKQPLKKNYLYYLSVKEMETILKRSKKPFASAKQSNIGMPAEFYDDLGINKLERRHGQQTTRHDHIKLNDSINVMLVNDTVSYFKQNYTEKVLRKLNKYDSNAESIFCDRNDITLNTESSFTEIQLTEAIHGLGTSSDKEFHKLRLSMFLNDTIIFLIEHCTNRNNLFILLEKNPKFYTLAGETNSAWEKYLSTQRFQEESAIRSLSGPTPAEDEKTRNMQSAWKNMLAKEMMAYTTEEGKVFCPFTGVDADFNNFSMLFIASHIKRHEHCVNNKESYNINNGLLLSANADALFDKHMITIGENKELVFSFLLKTNYELRNKLLLNQPIFKMILNDERMKNIEEHRKIFYEKEEERKKLGR